MVAGGCRCCGWVVWLLLGCGVGFGEAMVGGEVAGGVGWCDEGLREVRLEVSGCGLWWYVAVAGGMWQWLVEVMVSTNPD